MMKVLVVEDEPQLLQNIADYLKSFDDDIEVLTASSGEEGLTALDGGNTVDVLLTHASIPGHLGAAAFCEMIGWNGGTFEEIPNGPSDHPPNVRIPTTQLMLEAARSRDETRMEQTWRIVHDNTRRA